MLNPIIFDFISLNFEISISIELDSGIHTSSEENLFELSVPYDVGLRGTSI